MSKRLCKILLGAVVGAALILSAAVVSMAAVNEIEYSVVFNGERLIFDQNPINVNGRLLVPMRTIFEAYGAEIQWDETKQQVVAETVESEVILTIGKLTAMVDDIEFELDAPATIVGGRTMVPARFVSEALRGTVTWEEVTNTVFIEAELPEVILEADQPVQDEEEERAENDDNSISWIDEIGEINHGAGFFSDQEGIKGACYLTCLGMISSNLNDVEITASDVYAINNKTVSQGNWQALLAKLNIKRIHSLNIKALSNQEKITRITDLLKDNPEGVIIRLLNGSQSHYVVCKGFEGGKLIVNDPVGQIYVSLGKTWTGSSMFKSYDAAISGIVLLESYDKGDSEFSWDVLPNEANDEDDTDTEADIDENTDGADE